jgi:hypothetical protein
MLPLGKVNRKENSGVENIFQIQIILPGCASSRVQFEGGFSRPLIADIQPNIEKGDPFSHPSGS